MRQPKLRTAHNVNELTVPTFKNSVPIVESISTLFLMFY